MRNVVNFFRRSGFSWDERGSVTAESVLWLPVYLVFFALIADVSLMLHAQSKATRIAQDANRQASTGYIVGADDSEREINLENIIAAKMATISPNATIESSYGAQSIATTIEMPVTDLEVVGLFAKFSDITITVSTIHLLEL